MRSLGDGEPCIHLALVIIRLVANLIGMNIADTEEVTFSLFKSDTLLGPKDGYVFAGPVAGCANPPFGQKRSSLIGYDVVEGFLRKLHPDFEGDGFRRELRDGDKLRRNFWAAGDIEFGLTSA